MLARMQRASEYLHKGMDQPPNGCYGKQGRAYLPALAYSLARFMAPPLVDGCADIGAVEAVHIFIDFGQLCSSKPTTHVHGNRTAVFMISTTCFQAGQHP